MPAKTKIIALLCAALGMGMLSGCAMHPDWVKPGQEEASVVNQIGVPDSRIEYPDGRFTLVYSGQPFGFETYWMHFDKDGRFIGKERTMNEEHFKLVKVGVHTKADIYQLFGRCAQEYEFRLQDQTAYMYRFEEVGGHRMAFWVQFDRKDVVTEWAITQDPWDNDGDSLILN